MTSILNSILAALFGALAGIVNNYIASKQLDATKRQIGNLEYENFTQAQAMAQAEAAKTTAEIIANLDDDAIAERMYRTNDIIAKYYESKGSQGM